MRQFAVLGFSLFAFAGCGYEYGLPQPPIDPPPPPQLGPAWGAPVSGGTLLITRDGQFAVAADPDRDQIVTVSLADLQVAAEIELGAKDEPGRLIEDGDGRIHIALRRGGAVVTLGSPTGPLLARRNVCPEPRGLAWDPAGDVIHVACSGGELVTLPAAGGSAVRTLRLDKDLRDVVVVGDVLMLTRMKSAEVLTVDASGVVTQIDRSPAVTRNVFLPDTGELLLAESQPAVAWRAVPAPDGSGIIVAHQRARRSPLSTNDGGYSGDMCGGGIIESAATKFGPGLTPVAGRALRFTTLPIDVAISPDGQRLAFAMAGDQSVRVVRSTMLGGGDEDPCMMPPPPEDEEQFIFGPGLPTSVGFTPAGHLLVYYSEQRYLQLYPMPYQGTATWTIQLPGAYGFDPGRAIFYQMTGAGLACASCHPDGREDGLVWEFRDLGARRSQNVAGDILQRAPYHWDGDMDSLATLMNEVFVGRMGGQFLEDWQVQALGTWLDSVPAPAPPSIADADAVARGKAIFESNEVGCASCHSGSIFTNNFKFDVGTGGRFKVPSLRGIWARAPFIHTGCAPTLRGRFDQSCGGGDRHGVTSTLSGPQVDDLVAYLETL